ncbi:sodium channel protein Nach-like [Penaeus monodon]|uniref:sodium channel protein Nach-like n=1 Tax=Penaeus monodon TaxID=6687 RepID=UPI0018A7C488|nr:sodium channel protein Nach-like [Penaeus monodon]
MRSHELHDKVFSKKGIKTTKDIGKLEGSRCCHKMGSLQDMSYEDGLQETGLTILDERRKNGDIIMLFSYVAGRGKLFWILCWLVSLGACCYYIYTNLMEYQSSPILTTIDTTTYPITKFKFPSITLCNFNHIMKNRYPPEQEDVIGEKIYPDDEWHNLTYRLRHNLFSGETSDELYTRSQLKRMASHAYCTIKEGAQSCDDMIISCLWRSSQDCKSLFVQIPTHFGFCCVINVKGSRRSPGSLTTCPRDEAQQASTSSGQITQTNPMEITNAGVDEGLVVLLDTQRKEYVTTTYQAIGFKVVRIFLQESKTPPGLNNEGIVVSPGNEVFIPVRVSSTYTTAAAMGLPPSARKCFTDSEKQLFHYPDYYSYEACKSDFIAKKMVSHCKCLDYHMPGTFQNSSIFEDYLHKSCYPRCNTTSYTAVPTYGTLSRDRLLDPFVGPKHLLPLIKQLCDRSAFDVDIQNITRGLCQINTTEDAEHLMASFPESFTELLNYFMENIALVHVYFGQSTGTHYKKDVNATPSQIVAQYCVCPRFPLEAKWTEFWYEESNIGGLMGLFLGFSLLSGAEVVFYLLQIAVAWGASCLGRGYVQPNVTGQQRRR